MKKLILLLFIPLVFACSSDDSSDENCGDSYAPYNLRIDMTFTEPDSSLGAFLQQVDLPGYTFTPNDCPWTVYDGSEKAIVLHLKNGLLNNETEVTVTLTYFCEFSGVTQQRDVYIDFSEVQQSDMVFAFIEIRQVNTDCSLVVYTG